MLSQYVVVTPIFDYIKQHLGNKPSERAMSFLSILVYKSNKKYGSPDEFVDMPQGMLESIMTSKYFTTLKFLKEHKLIIANEYYSKEANQCKQYRANIAKLATLYNVGGTDGSPYVPAAYNVLPKWGNFPHFKGRDLIIKDLQRIAISPKNLYGLAEKIITNHSIKFCNLDDFEDTDPIVMLNKGKFFQKNAREAILDASVKGMEIVKRRGYYKQVNPDHELMVSTFSKNISYTQSIFMWENGLLYANRNTTNTRLDTNATQTPNPIFERILFDNNLAQIDLRNSQFCILASMLPITREFKFFKSLVNSGDLYTFVKETLNLKSRDDAKSRMFELMFASHKLNNSSKAKLREVFPEVVEWIDNFKIVNGDNTFAIELQKREANIFIDKVLRNAKRTNRFCLTKHDSLIVKQEDIEYAERSINEQLGKNKIVGALKTSGAQIR